MSDSSISLDACLPLTWEIEDTLSSYILQQRCYANISLLKALAAIDTATQERDDVPEAVRKYLERVESKLDVLLMLVARLTAESTQLPPACDIKLSQAGICWKPHSDNLPEIGERISIYLFLTTRVPQPLILQAIVRTSVSGEIVADLVALEEELSEWITRTIFRYHRRAVHARNSHDGGCQ